MKNGLETYTNGDKSYYLEGKLHRTDGPAIEWANGHKEWFLEGKLHRVDGPACEWANGGKYWYYHGTKLDCSSQEEFEKLLRLKAFW